MVRKVVVLSYDPIWAAKFRIEADTLVTLWRDEIVAIHHVGSTAIPETSAKPIIDLLVEVCDIEAIDQFDPDWRNDR